MYHYYSLSLMWYFFNINILQDSGIKSLRNCLHLDHHLK